MSEDSPYLSGLPFEDRRRLAAANQTGLTELLEHFAEDRAVAFLGAGASAPLYPLWSELIEDLIDLAVHKGLSVELERTCRLTAAQSPDVTVEIVSNNLGHDQYQAVLRDLLRVRRDPEVDAHGPRRTSSFVAVPSRVSSRPTTTRGFSTPA